MKKRILTVLITIIIFIVSLAAPLSVTAYAAEPQSKILTQFSTQPYNFAVSKEDFPYDYTEFSDAELEIIKSSETLPIVVGIVDDSAPLCFWNDETQTYDGIVIEMLNIVSQKTGLKFKYVPVDLTRSADATNPNENSPDLVAAIIKCDTLPDERDWLLSNELMDDSMAIVGLQGTNLAENPSKKTIAVMSSSVMTKEFVSINLPNHNIVEYETLSDCMDAVAAGEADATAYMQSCINHLLQKPLYEDMEIIPTYSENASACVAGFTPESEILIHIINNGLQMITEEESWNTIINYTIMNPYQLTFSDLIYKHHNTVVIIAFLIIAIIVVLIIFFLFRRKSILKIEAALTVAKQASAAKGNFMSRMSHEIRTPLNAIIGYNTLARNEIAESKTDADRRQAEMKVMDSLTKSDIASRHLLTIINDVLDMSAIESGKIVVVNERFDFKGLITSLSTIFYSQAKAKAVDFDILFDTMTEEWLVGDQMRVSQILTNLLSNAIKFTPEGGKVTLSIKANFDADLVHIHFTVTDTGIGMEKEYLEHIWTPFEQADSSISRRFGGTGLGLAITKTLVDLMNGVITVKSKPGEGSTFNVSLSFSRTEQPKESATYDFSQINALIVDDDASTCDYIKLLLTRCGVRSLAVTSGYDAIDAVKIAIKKNEPYTVCLVDWRMPKMDGIETIKRIRDIVGADLPIIVITAYDFSEVIDQAKTVGVNMFISKPLFQSSIFDLLANINGVQMIKEIKVSKEYDFSGMRIILAEDNNMNMEIAMKILESSGFSVDCVSNGEEAVSLFCESPSGTYDAILMDVRMPVMDGHRATQTIRSSDHPDAKTIPIIAMTADAFAENVAEALESGMNAHIAKPIDLPTLFSTLDNFIGKEKHLQ